MEKLLVLKFLSYKIGHDESHLHEVQLWTWSPRGLHRPERLSNPNPKGIRSKGRRALRSPQTHSVFSFKDQGMPASLIRTLLLSVGIGANPGPHWSCTKCSNRASPNIVRCQRCANWTHLRCTSLRSFNELNSKWRCATCDRVPTIEQPITTLDCIRIVQWNANSIRSRSSEIEDFLNEMNIHIAIIQETKLERGRFLIHSRMLRKDRTNAGDGLAKLKYTILPYSLQS